MSRIVPVIALLVMLPVVPLRAQSTVGGARPLATDAQIAQVQMGARKMSHPAEWVLEFKQDFNLTDDQVTKLQALVLAQRDSEAVRMAKPRPMSPGTMALGKAMMDWSSPIDEAAIRAGACDAAQASVDIQMNMVRDQHAVGAILTPAQRALVPSLQMKMMMNGVKP